MGHSVMNLSELEGQSIVVYDLEIKEEIGKNGVTWKTYDKMGISVGCFFDYRTMDYGVCMDDNIGELAKLVESCELLVGFNIEGFDNNLLNAVAPFKRTKEIYDILYYSRRSVGWNPEKNGYYPPGLKLDNHLETTFGPHSMKTANGEEAPRMWQRKEYGKLISYCLADVKREKMLFEHIVKRYQVSTKAHGSRMLQLPKFIERLECPEAFEDEDDDLPV